MTRDWFIIYNFILPITIKTKEEIEALREGGRKIGQVLKELAASVKPGLSPLDLDRLAESLILKSGGLPAFKGYKSKGSPSAFPFTICFSRNEEIVHGAPNNNPIKDGDVIKLDIGMKYPASALPGRPAGLYTDTAVTVAVGKVSKDINKLIKVTKDATNIGIKRVCPGARVGDISSAIQEHLEKNKIGIVRDLAGHGVGYDLHEDPLIPNYGQPGKGVLIEEGMVLAIEVMTNLGNGKIKLGADGYAYVSLDGTIGAHHEHTVVVTKDGAEIITE